MENTSMNFNVFAETVVRELKKTMGERFQITTTVVKTVSYTHLTLPTIA